MAAKEPKPRTTADKESDDPRSGPRLKGATDSVELMMAELRRRSQGLEGEELEQEIERFVGLMIERNLKGVPERMQGEMREYLRGTVERDPTLQAMLEDLRGAAKR